MWEVDIEFLTSSCYCMYHMVELSTTHFNGKMFWNLEVYFVFLKYINKCLLSQTALIPMYHSVIIL